VELYAEYFWYLIGMYSHYVWCKEVQHTLTIYVNVAVNIRRTTDNNK
jgi:hypothetical protein